MALVVILIPPFLVGCNHTRPNFPVQNQSSSGQSSSILSYNTITFDAGIKIRSSTLSATTESFIVETGSLMKISIDTNFAGITKLISTTGKAFYFNRTSGKLINGIKINALELSLAEIENYITVNYDMHISLVETPINLRAIMLCHKYSTADKNTTYTKFNYISSNFRNSLLGRDDENNLTISNSVQYIIFDNTKTSISENVSNKISLSNSNKQINIDIETAYEAEETSVVFVFEDESNNLFLSDVKHLNNYSQTKNNIKTSSHIILDDTFTILNLNLAKYYLPL